MRYTPLMHPHAPPPTHLWTLPHGLTVAFERRSGPGFSFDLRLPWGSAHDPHGQEGTAAVLEEWLHKGAAGLDARQLQDAFDDLGVRRGGGVGPEATRLSVSGLLADLPRALGLVADVLLRPTLPPAEVPVLLDLARQDIESLQDSPTDLLAVQGRALAFGGTAQALSGFGHPSSGTLDGLSRISAQSLRAHFAGYGAQGSVLGLVADLSAEDALKLVTVALGDWQPGTVRPLHAPFCADRTVHLPYPDGEQTHLSLLAPGVAPTHPDWLKWQLALTALSGGSSSRLFYAVREERGLAYAVSASPLILGREGFLNVYAGSTPERAPETLEVIRAELERLQGGLDAAEFRRAHAGLSASVVFGNESLRGRAHALTRDLALFGRVRSVASLRAELDALTLQDVNAFLGRYAPLRGATLVTLGPAAEDAAKPTSTPASDPGHKGVPA